MKPFGSLVEHIGKVFGEISAACDVEALNIKVFYNVQQIKYVVGIQLFS